MLPFFLRKAMILAAVCLMAVGMVAFCAGVLQDSGDKDNKLRIGYAAEENMVTDLAVSYVQDMESVNSICSLEAVTEQEGRQLLEKGELSALIVLPRDVINEILSGSNTPATLYLPGNDRGAVSGGGLSAVGSMLFEELASAAIGMLGTAQAEIYASGAVLQELEAGYGAGVFGDGFLQSVYDDINRFNLEVVTGREKLFRVKTLSLTENDTYVVYFGSAFFTIYMMFAGLFLGKFCKRSSLQQTMADRRIGVGYAAQLGTRCLAGSMLMLLVMLLPFLAVCVLYLMPQVDRILTIGVSWQGFASLLLITGFMTVYHMMIYQIIEKRESALVVIGVLAILQAYLSGCLIPSVLLPGTVVSIGKYLPAAMVKKGFTVLFTGDAQGFSYVALGLCIWGICLFLCTVLSMRPRACLKNHSCHLHSDAEASHSPICVIFAPNSGYIARYAPFIWHKSPTNCDAHLAESIFQTRPGEQNKSAGGQGAQPARLHVPSLGMVMLRRLLHKKSMWISLGAIVVMSAVILQVEKDSGTQIKVAVYDESGDYVKLLEAYEGLVLFEQYESDAAVRGAVYKGDAECGYVLPKALAEDMTARRAAREILVYQDADAVATSVVNEILFERIFRQVSLKWFEDHIVQNDRIKELGIGNERLRGIVRDCFNAELLEGTTFRFEVRRMDTGTADTERIGSDVDEESRTVYPVYVVAAAAVVLCALQGVLQIIADIRKQRFYKRSRWTVSVLTLSLPLMLGVLCAVLIMMTG